MSQKASSAVDDPTAGAISRVAATGTGGIGWVWTLELMVTSGNKLDWLLWSRGWLLSCWAAGSELSLTHMGFKSHVFSCCCRAIPASFLLTASNFLSHATCTFLPCMLGLWRISENGETYPWFQLLCLQVFFISFLIVGRWCWYCSFWARLFKALLA